MAMEMEEGLRLDDLTGVLRRRAPLVAVVAGAATLLAIFVAAVLPNRYRASATLLVEPQTISQLLVEGGIAEEDINSRLHIIQMQILSRTKLSRVIDEFDVYPELSRQLTREEIIDHMREQIELAPVLPELESEPSPSPEPASATSR
jgi:succinoglycan biosynthesis transport protein ExoP